MRIFLIRRLQILLFSVMFMACTGRHVYKKAAKQLAAKLPDSKNMNAGSSRYTLDVPEGWATEHKTMYGVDYFYLLAPPTKDDPHTNINVITEYMQGLSLDSYRTKTIASVKKMIPTTSNFDTGSIKANGLNGCWYSYDMEMQGIHASIVTYIFPKDGVAYIITAGTQAELAMRYRRLFNAVARSFRFSE